jgi:hypothetical protein
MTENEKLIWAAAFASAMSIGASAKLAVQRAGVCVQHFRLVELDAPNVHVEMLQEMKGK